jgi:murein DD-endopeptidase MepM/ murein hydrolase activator NlpD
LKKYGLVAAGEKLVSGVAQSLEHHPRKITALIATLLFCGGGAAFAVASLDPQADDVQVRQIVESVQPLPVQQQVDALDLHELNLYRTDLTRSNDTAETLLARLGISDAAAASYLRHDRNFRAQLLGHAGRAVTAEADGDQALLKLSARWAPEDNGTFRRLVVERSPGGGFTSRVELAPLSAATRMGSATIRSSLSAAAEESHIPDSIVGQVIDILSGDIDFRHALRKGDRFNVVYEALEADGEPLRTGRVLSVEFVNKGQTYQAMWFQEPGHKGGYYTLDGKSLQTSYLSSPLEFSRVTSGFEMRFHPILHQWKAHLGIDFAGAIGTPVRTVGDGTVEFSGWQNGFGNVVMVRHNATDETVYAHLSRIDVRQGQNVNQGQRIGAVGATGWATGPHLHFEFRVNGVHQDPVQYARRSESNNLSADAMPAFERIAHSMRLQLAAAASNSVVASAQ